MFPTPLKLFKFSCLTVVMCVCILLALKFGPALRAEKTPAKPVFEKDILPILQARCTRCHGEKRKRADLDLTSFANLLKGGESGPVIVPSDVKKSRLYELVHKGEMPPTGKDLTKEQVALIHRWIEVGAPATTVVVKSEPAVTQHDIEPLLRLRCTVCHGGRVQEAGLDLRTKAAMLKGGKSGPALVPGNPTESLLLKKIHSEQMPPRNKLILAGVKPMAKDEIEKLTLWIKRGAPEVNIEPDVATTEPDLLVTDKDRNFWSFQPPRVVSVPKVNNTELVNNPIDAFLLRKLEEKNLTFAPKADRGTLLRRVTFDLTGLPPSPEDMANFLADQSPNAYEKAVDRLLASPRYGERWGRFWLDLAGYADSEGKRSADPIRPHAWRYRDYVIRSLNADKPYDRFLQEQIAGDELVDYQNAKVITPEMMDCLVATGFLRMTADGTGSDVVNRVPDRLDVIADEIQVLGSAVMGITVHCARCHSHKYDPIPHRDYYRLLAIFKGAYDEHDWMRPTSVVGQSKSKRPTRALPNITPAATEQWRQYLDDVKQEIARLAKEKTSVAKAQTRALQTVVKADPQIRALWDRGEPSPTYIYRRGDYLQPSKLVGPGVPSVLTDGKTPFVVTPPFPGAKSTGRRLAFAKWLTQSNHPLTARVMVNRIWNHHFGRGIVTTLDNFGKTGAAPTHPGLLDWLAAEFVKRDWSMKAMHRFMVTSRAYRQTSNAPTELVESDPENRLLSRMPLKRMEAEALYDSLLLISGQLDETRFGPPDGVVARNDGLVMAVKNKRGWRRSIYVRQRRTQMLTLLETFDLPQMNPNCIARIDSTVASQALYLQNNAVVYELAEKFAERIRKHAGDDKSRIERIYQIAMNRPPTTEERNVGLQAIEQLRKHWSAKSNGADEDVNERAWTSYCHAIMNSAAFLYID